MNRFLLMMVPFVVACVTPAHDLGDPGGKSFDPFDESDASNQTPHDNGGNTGPTGNGGGNNGGTNTNPGNDNGGTPNNPPADPPSNPPNNPPSNPVDTTTDSDNDGLTDHEESGFGTDPNARDSDGDGYWDSWEIDEGTDPTRPGSRIYEGYWPYNPDKDAMPTGGNGSARRGQPAPRLSVLDQFGEQLDLFDLAGQGKPIIIDTSAEWCGPCQELAQYMSHTASGWNSWSGDQNLARLRDKVDAGDVIWVTLLAENASGQVAGQNTLAGWANAFPHDGVPVVNDPNRTMTGWGGVIQPSQYPSLSLLDENMVWMEINDTNAAVRAAVNY